MPYEGDLAFRPRPAALPLPASLSAPPSSRQCATSNGEALGGLWGDGATPAKVRAALALVGGDEGNDDEGSDEDNEDDEDENAHGLLDPLQASIAGHEGAESSLEESLEASLEASLDESSLEESFDADAQADDAGDGSEGDVTLVEGGPHAQLVAALLDDAV